VDWDWEDGPQSDTPPPRRAADEPEPAADPGPPEPERPRRPEPEPLDETVTQVFSADAAWDLARDPAPVESAPPPAPLEYVLPDRTETGRVAASNDEFAHLPPAATEEGAEYGRRPRSPQDRAARREQRRRQLRRRRLVALAILVAIVVLIVVLVVRGCGGSGAGASAAVIGMVFVDRRLLAAAERR
jgi:hypothetical protein